MSPAPDARLASSTHLIVRKFGIVPYEPAWQAMKDFVAGGQDRPDELWVLQHEPVYTRGLRCKDLPAAAGRHIPVISVDRGGLMTYHGPGQLVMYCMMSLERRGVNIRQVVRGLEHTVIAFLQARGVASDRRDGAPGVFVGDRKLASIGLRVRNRRTYHGISINLDMDLTPFSWIDPCGFKSLQVVQIRDLLPEIDWQECQRGLVSEFARSFGYELHESRPSSFSRSDASRRGVPISIQAPS